VLALYTGVWLVVMGLVELVWGFQMRKDSKTLREVGDAVLSHIHEAKKAS
jgi:uncharacterized membrane protein HdeD (DUF308 family)